MKQWQILFVLWLAVLAAIGGWLYRRPAAPMPAFWTVPSFTMTAVTSKRQFPVNETDLRGRPWVAAFIFTNCTGPCPRMSARMAHLQTVLPAPARLISFTVDPDRDTPPVLAAYAKRFDADPERWWFLRAAPAEVERVAVQGFKVGLEKNSSAPSGLRFTHSTKFALVDSSGTIRGFYESLDAGFAQALKRDIEKL